MAATKLPSAVALNGLGAPALAQMPTNIPGVTEENADEYDVEQAKAYLQESGIDPSTVTFSIICSDDTKKRAGEVVQANLKEIGIECTLESMDLATYLSATVTTLSLSMAELMAWRKAWLSMGAISLFSITHVTLVG